MSKERLGKVTAFLKKYRYGALILLLGLVLLVLPGREKEKKQDAREKVPLPSAAGEDYARQMEARLEAMLSNVAGAGPVEVMLTLAAGPETSYQCDVQTQEEENGGEKRRTEDRKTVILSRGSAYDEGAVAVVTCPSFRGALVVCRGGDSASVRYELTRSVAALTGLPTDRITVVKMK